MLVCVAIAGVVSYNNHKLKKEVTQAGGESAAAAAVDDREELKEVGASLVSQDERDRLIDR